MSNKQPETIAVDSNPLLAALRGGNARTIIFSGKFSFITTEYTTWKVKKYIPELAMQSAVSESELFYAFDRFPIVSVPPVVYDERRKQAEALIAHRDHQDVDILALALKFNTNLWTNDKDFENIYAVQIFTTADMLHKLAALTN